MPKRHYKPKGKGRGLKVVGSAKHIHIRSLDRRLVVEKLGRNCHWCGIYTDDTIYNRQSPRKTTIDHLYNKLDPRRKGNDDKVVVACEACNLMRARMHEYIFGQHKFPISYALEIEQEATSIEAVKVEIEVPEVPPTPKPYVPPVIRGPVVIVDVPPLTRWQKLVASVSLKLWKLKQRFKKKFLTRKG